MKNKRAKLKVVILAYQLHQDLVKVSQRQIQFLVSQCQCIYCLSKSILYWEVKLEPIYQVHPHICFDKRTMHLSHPYQRGQNSDAAFFIRQSKTVPRTVNTMVSETDSDQSLFPGPSHICIKQHPKQFGSEMNLLESPVPPQATQCVFLQLCVISNHLTQAVSK